MSQAIRFRPRDWWKYLLSLLIVLLHCVPLYILVGVALKTGGDLSSRWVMPGYIEWRNFETVLFRGNMLTALKNTGIITLCSVAGITLIGAISAYPLARNRSRPNAVIKRFVVGVMMVPALCILVPLYSTMVRIGGISNYWGIITVLITFQLPMSIFLYSNFIQAIPTALDEAAAIDGCGPFLTFFRIILPQLKPVTASVIIMTGVSCWNDYQFSLYLLQSPRLKTITLTVSGYFAMLSSDVHAAAAAALVGVLPLVVLFLFLQKYFIRGIVDSAIK